MKSKLDILIIGAGPIGIACALEAKKNNLKYLIVEKGVLVNSLYHYPTNMTFFSTSEKLEIDDIPFISSNAKPNKKEALEYYRRIVSSNKLNVKLFEKVEMVSSENDMYNVTTDKNSYQAKNIIISTGFYDIPNYLNIPGEELPKVFHYYNDPHYFSEQDVVIVGASNSAVDAALEIYRKGGRVTMIIRGEGIGERVKYWVRPDIINRIEEGSIKVFYNAELKEISKKNVIVITKTGEEIELKNDFVVALTGYQPNFNFLNKIGIELSTDGLKKPNYNVKTMESNLKGIYLAGVICGGKETHKWFIENSRIHAKMIIGDIVSK